MNTLMQHLKRLQEINADFSNTDTVALLKNIEDEISKAKVYVPFIGRFSTGKSALINSLLGVSLLPEDITPETAISTEIKYTRDASYCVYIMEDGAELVAPIQRVREEKPAGAKYMQVFLGDDILKENHFLRDIPDVVIVDFPGFESGFIEHDKAIFDYIGKSMAYILTFAADDANLTKSMQDTLADLKLAKMPVCVAITKSDKKAPDSDVAIRNLRSKVQELVGKSDIQLYETSSYDKSGVDTFKGYFKKLQDNAPAIIRNKYISTIQTQAEQLLSFLSAYKNNLNLSESELKEKKQALERDYATLFKQVDLEKDKFQQDCLHCQRDILDDVRNYLHMSTDRFARAAKNRGDVDSQIKRGITSTVTQSLQSRFAPLVDKYKSNMELAINVESIGGIHITLAKEGEGISSEDVATVITTVGNFFLKTTSWWISLVAPIINILKKLFSSHSNEEELESIKDQLRGDIYPQVLEGINSELGRLIDSQIRQVNESIEGNIQQQKEGLEKAIADAETKLHEEEHKKEEWLHKINQATAEAEGMIK